MTSAFATFDLSAGARHLRGGVKAGGAARRGSLDAAEDGACCERSRGSVSAGDHGSRVDVSVSDLPGLGRP